MSREGIHADSSKIEAARKWPVPQSTTDVRKFLGHTGYYHRFVKSYATLARQLTDLLVGHPMKQNGKRKKVVGKTPFTWGTEEQASFEAIKSLLTSPHVLAYADYSKSFELHTDASFNGSWSTAVPGTRWQEKGHSLREPKSKTSREELPCVQA